MRKVLSILLVLFMIFAFVACDPESGKPQDETQKPGDSSSTNPESGDDTKPGTEPEQPTYQVGKVGPAGGYIFYDKGNDEGGWRYLEAAPADLRVINGVPTVDATSEIYQNAAIEDQYVIFGYYRTTPTGADVFLNGTTTYNAANCTKTAVGTGKANTQLMIDVMGAAAYVHPSYASADKKEIKSAEYAAKLVDQLTYTVNNKTFNDWFIPSFDEVKLLYQNLYMNSLGGFGTFSYASSSENSKPDQGAGTQTMLIWSFSENDWNVVFRGNAARVRPVRAF